jgi:hypothetical protein
MQNDGLVVDEGGYDHGVGQLVMRVPSQPSAMSMWRRGRLPSHVPPLLNPRFAQAWTD